MSTYQSSGEEPTGVATAEAGDRPGAGEGPTTAERFRLSGTDLDEACARYQEIWRGRDFRGSLVGIVGYGAIGRHTAQLAAKLGARVCVLRRSGPADGFETVADLAQLLPRVDILSLHCPLNEHTRGLIGAAELAALQPGAVLVNTARGAIIDEDAMIDALKSGHIRHAGLDVFNIEPLPADHPLTKLENVTLSAHSAFRTPEASENLMRAAWEHCRRIVEHR